MPFVLWHFSWKLCNIKNCKSGRELRTASVGNGTPICKHCLLIEKRRGGGKAKFPSFFGRVGGGFARRNFGLIIISQSPFSEKAKRGEGACYGRNWLQQREEEEEEGRPLLFSPFAKLLWWDKFLKDCCEELLLLSHHEFAYKRLRNTLEEAIKGRTSYASLFSFSDAFSRF